MRTLILLAAGAAIAYSAEPVAEHHATGKLWKASVIAFIASQAADAATSYGYPEANSLYGERFGARGIALKVAIVGGTIPVERFLIRRHPGLERPLAIFNLVVTGTTSRAVIYNARDMASTQPAAPAPINIIPGVGTVRP